MKIQKSFPLLGGGGLRERRIILLFLLAASLSAAPVLIGGYNEGIITIPENDVDTATIVELSFSVDTARYAQFTAGGLADIAKMLLELDGNNLFPTSYVEGYRFSSIHIVYIYPLALGDHNIRLKMTHGLNNSRFSCTKAYLQVLIFLPDDATAVAESGMENPEGYEIHSVVSRGPYVNAPGATELINATGRTIENATADRIQISTLPRGTYFARGGERTVVKIVKVD